MDDIVIGKTIRDIRLKSGFTLAELSEKADLTKSALSKIETGRSSPPVSTLARIADALAVPLADFFVEPAASERYAVTRKGDGVISFSKDERSGYAYEALVTQMRNKYIEPFILTIDPEKPDERFHHHGHELAYVLSGRVAFHIGDDCVKLGPGDTVYFHAEAPHVAKAVGKRPVRMLVIFVQSEPPRAGG